MDRVGPQARGEVIGRLDPLIEAQLAEPAALHAVARELVHAEFPPTVAGDVLAAVGLDPAAAVASVPGALSLRFNPVWCRVTGM